MARPTLKVEAAFDAGITGTPTWTDITSHVRVNPGVEANHWRRDEGSTCEPSRCSLTLINNDGRYTPGNTSSPLSPNIKKGRRLRVTSILNGEEFPRFTGYVDDWRAEWPATVGHISDCRVTASSRMAYLGRGNELRSIVEETILSDSPAALYPLSEPVGATSASDVSGNGQPSMSAYGSGAPLTFGDGVATFADGQGLRASNIAASTPTVVWVECVFNTSTPGNQQLVWIESPSGDNRLQILINSQVSCSTDGGAGGSAAVASSVTYDDGEDHHVVAVATEGVGLTLYIDGTSVGTDSEVALNFDEPMTTLYAGIGASMANPFTGTLAQVSAGFSALSSTRAADHADAALSGFADEEAGTRLGRYAGFAGVTASEVDAETGQVPNLAHIDTTGMTALSAMRAVEETEGGVLFDALDGTLTFHDRAHRYEAAAFGTLLGGGFFGGGPHGTEFTLSVAQGHIASAPFPVLDDQRQVNDMSNTNADGVTGRQKDQDSIDDHGLYRDGKTLHTTNPDEPLLRASWTVNRYAEPLTRVSEIEVDIHALPDELAAVVLAAQVGTIFTIADLPDNAPSDTMHLFVEGRTDRITGNEDRVIFRTSPVEVFEVFTLDDPVRGVIDSAYPLAY